MFFVMVFQTKSVNLRHFLAFQELTDPVVPDYQLPILDPPKQDSNIEADQKNINQELKRTFYTSQEQCQRRCAPVINSQKCRQNCQQARINSGLFFIAGALFVTSFFGIGFCCALYHWEFRKQKSLRNLVVKYKQNPEENEIPIEVFENHRKRFIQMIKQTNNKQSLYKLAVQNGDSVLVQQIQEAKMTKQAPYLYKLEMKGKNPKGQWTAQGYYLVHQIESIYVWFMKDYKDKQKDGQIGTHKHLIFDGKLKVSSNSNLSEFNPAQWYEYIGRWFYKDCERQKNLSGKWKLTLSQKALKISSKKLLSNKQISSNKSMRTKAENRSDRNRKYSSLEQQRDFSQTSRKMVKQLQKQDYYQMIQK